jgi:hypothetical protein
VGALGVLGPRGYWKMELITLTDLALNFYPVCVGEPCEVVELVFVGFLLLGMSCHSHEATC